MNPYLELIPYLCNPEIYKEYRPYIELDKSVDKEIHIIYKALDDVHNTRNPTSDTDIYRSIKEGAYSSAPSKSFSNLETLFSKLDSLSNSDRLSATESVPLLLHSLKTRGIYTRLGEECFNLAAGDGDIERFRSLTDEINSSIGDLDSIKPDRNIISKSLEELFEATIKNPGLRWRLSSLNKSLGSLRKGNFMFVFARPETGKTTFLASEITHMVQQTDRPILWFNNEEQGEIVLTRCYQAALGVTIQELMENREEHERKFIELTNGNIKIYDSASIHRRDVERVCEAHQPALVVFDQIDKLQGFIGDREDLRLGSVYQWARELAKRFAPVIGITQADGGAEGKKWLDMADVMNAKTAKQAEADAILGIGKVPDPQLEFIRFLNISKNKLFGDQDSLPELRHGRLEVLIQPEIARYKDLI